jgi:uncharacterized repeat protein (TIGR02543 family)
MKRVLIFGVALLAVFAMISCGGDDSSGTTTCKVTFNADGGTPAPAAVDVEKGQPLGSKYPTSPTKEGFTFGGWFDGTTEYTAAAPKVEKDVTVKAKWETDIINPDGPIVEKVTLSNGAYVVYRFDLPDGRVWEDYESMSVDYKVDDATEWSAGNSAGGTRLHGSYTRDDFTFVDIAYRDGTTVVPKAIASFNAGKNTEYCLDSGFTSWGTVASFANNFDGEVGEWFTATYSISGTKKHGDFKPENAIADSAAGPFYFALGISARNGNYSVTTQFIRNVTLVGYEGIDDVIATPAIFEDTEGTKYPAFIGYPDTSGDNGAEVISRTVVEGTPAATIPVTFTTYSITMNPNYPTDAVSEGRVTTTAKETDKNGNLSGVQLARLTKIAHTDGGDKAFIFTGWFTVSAATGGAAISANYKFTANTEIFARWKEINLPSPPEPLVIEGVALDFDTSGLGQGASAIAIYEIPAEAYDYYYETIKVYCTVADYVAVEAGAPLKLIFKAAANGLNNDWGSIGGNSESYLDRTANGDFTWDYTFEIDGFSHIKIQDNSGTDKATGTVTITKIEFLATEYADS